jgi:flagellar biosynthesis/type III secretory pathway protein FliH
MPARNPHDRRRPAGEEREESRRGMMLLGEPPAALLRVLQMEDLEAMAFSVGRRADRMARETIPAAEHTARREGWDEGHAAGYSAAEMDVLARIDAAYGDRLVFEAVATRKMVEMVEENARSVSKADLVARLRLLLELLNGLTADQQLGFER